MVGGAVDPYVAVRARSRLRQPPAVRGILAPHGGPGHGPGGVPERLRLDGAPPGESEQHLRRGNQAVATFRRLGRMSLRNLNHATRMSISVPCLRPLVQAGFLRVIGTTKLILHVFSFFHGAMRCGVVRCGSISEYHTVTMSPSENRTVQHGADGVRTQTHRTAP